MSTSTLTDKGQTTVPIEIRQATPETGFALRAFAASREIGLGPFGRNRFVNREGGLPRTASVSVTERGGLDTSAPREFRIVLQAADAVLR